MNDYKKCNCCKQKIFTKDEIIELKNGEWICPACISGDCNFVHDIMEIKNAI